MLVEQFNFRFADASSFDVSRLKFCPECGQLLLQEDGTAAIDPVPRRRGRPRKRASEADRRQHGA